MVSPLVIKQPELEFEHALPFNAEQRLSGVILLLFHTLTWPRERETSVPSFRCFTLAVSF